MANVYPPSPAPSVCDSLAEIEDLDAFLDAQGKLSRWPTPPLDSKHIDAVAVAEVEDGDGYDSDDSADGADDEVWRLASAFTDIATGHEQSSYFDFGLVVKVLMRAQVPVEVLALAFNILRAIAPSAVQRASGQLFPIPDLAVTACLSLATTFLDDKAPRSEWWTKEVCKGFWPAEHIDKTTLDFLLHPNLAMLALSSEPAIDEATLELCAIANGEWTFGGGEKTLRALMEDVPSSSVAIASPPKLSISDTTRWIHGEVTPAETPTVESHTFLRLL